MASLQHSFWRRNGLQDTDKAKCLEAVQGRYEDYHVETFMYQGYCSFTLLLTLRVKIGADRDRRQNIIHLETSGLRTQLLIQLRPAQYAFDLGTTVAARRMHPTLAPVVRDVDLYLPGGLQAFEMNSMDGIPFFRRPSHEPSTRADLSRRQETLITSFATVIAQSWPSHERKKRRDSVLQSEPCNNKEETLLSLCIGKVGSRILPKLQKLSSELPDEWLRARAAATLDELRKIHDYPIVLNHGDLIPSNILVNDETWEITGLVDWAEAEWLPFGTCLYGLEHLLGVVQSQPQELGGTTFVHYDNAAQLRERFWSTLVELVPEIGGRTEEVKLMRDVGVFLWHGYAWDEGAIDRVVNEVNDVEELAKLRAFLAV